MATGSWDLAKFQSNLDLAIFPTKMATGSRDLAKFQRNLEFSRISNENGNRFMGLQGKAPNEKRQAAVS